jgi:hypothetical protein
VAETGPAAAHGVGDRLDRVVLPDDAPVQELLEPQQPVALAALSSATGMPVRRATIWATSSAVIRGLLAHRRTTLPSFVQLAGEHHRALVVLGVDGHVARPAQLLDAAGTDGAAVRAQPGPGGGPVDQVDGLVGQEAVA